MAEPPRAKRRNRRSFGQSRSTCATASAMTDASLIHGGRPAKTLREEIISKHIKCDEQGVEVGRHAASLVGVASATPDFDAQPEDHSPAAIKTESTI